MDLVDPDFHKHALAHSRTMQAEIKKLLDEAVAAGELQECDTRKLARTVQSLLGGSMLQWAIDRELARPSTACMRISIPFFVRVTAPA